MNILKLIWYKLTKSKCRFCKEFILDEEESLPLGLFQQAHSSCYWEKAGEYLGIKELTARVDALEKDKEVD